MSTKAYSDHLNAFQKTAQTTQEKIINNYIDNPINDPLGRILQRFTRDMQLIVTNSAAEISRLHNADEENVGRAVVLLAKSMLQGVAAITAPFTEHPEGAAVIVNYFRNEITLIHQSDDDDE